jgi:hypothetical protein
MNKDEQEEAGQALDFVNWIKDELKHGNCGMDVELGQLTDTEAQALLKKIVEEVNGL